jgi:hypothetical protein
MAYAGALVPYLVLIDDVAQAAEFARACSDDGVEDTTGADRSDAELIAPFFVSHVANIYANLKVARDRASDNVRAQPHTALWCRRSQPQRCAYSPLVTVLTLGNVAPRACKHACGLLLRSEQGQLSVHPRAFFNCDRGGALTSPLQALDASSVMRIAFKLDTDNSLLNRSLLKSLKETLANMLRLAVPPKTTDDQAQGTARLLLPMVHADDVIRGVNEIKNGFTGCAPSPNLSPVP